MFPCTKALIFLAQPSHTSTWHYFEQLEQGWRYPAEVPGRAMDADHVPGSRDPQHGPWGRSTSEASPRPGTIYVVPLSDVESLRWKYNKKDFERQMAKSSI